MHERENALKEWLTTLYGNTLYTLKPLAGDASFRRYFRLHVAGESLVVMDAPPEKEGLDSFIYIANTLANAHIPVPQLLAQNKAQGFLLLTDFGDRLLLQELNTLSVNNLYHKSMHVLLSIQQCDTANLHIPPFDKAFMHTEMSLFIQWFLGDYLQLSLQASEQLMIQNTLEWIAHEVTKQPKVLIHRDYHSRNLMLLDNEHNIGVIDFQDAMSGPVTYDLVSLLKDCYVSWPREDILAWVAYFYDACAHAQAYNLDEFIKAFDLCGLQRHLKVLGIFCRLYLRDGKANYLKDLPLTLSYVTSCCALYKELHPLLAFLQKRVHLP